MKVSEIFNSIEGEGKRVGLPCTFVRLFGCNLRCSYCDSMYAVEGNSFNEMSIEDIIAEVDSLNCPNVTVTGGEPLIHKDCVSLLYELCNRGYKVNVETNGSIQLIARHPNLFYTVDYKTLSSGESDEMLDKVFTRLEHKDVIKFVVGNKYDLVQAKTFMDSTITEAQIYVSPIFGKIEASEIVDFIKEHELWNWHTQLQLHKYIWEPDKRGV